MSTGDFPKVLLVADSAVGDRSGTGITLANLYARWPSDRLAQVCGRPLLENRNYPDIPTLQVDKSLVPGYGALRTAQALIKRPRRKTEVGSSSVQPASKLPPPQTRRSWEKAWLDLAPLRVRRQLAGLVSSFEPDVVVTTSGSVRVTRLANAAASLARVPVVPHFMDDWIATQYRDSPASRIPRLLLERELGQLFERAPRGLAITQVMADEYAQRFGIPFTAVGNLVNVKNVDAPPLVPRAEIRLGYIGGLHLGRDAQLLRLAHAIEQRSDVTLSVIAPGNAERRAALEWSSLRRTRLMDPVEAEEVLCLASAFDVLVHVESFDEDQRRYTRLSMSTKMSQYLSVGRPVLAVGPEEVASIRYVKSQGVGIVVGETDAGLDLALSELVEPEVREAFGRRAAECALRDFDLDRGTERMRAWLRQI